MTLDGKRQRSALAAAERALQALGDGNVERVMRNAGKAADLDQLGIFGGLPDAVTGAADDFVRAGSVGAASWDCLKAVVSPGPLQFLIHELRGPVAW